jgi:aspartyl-tRNA(Asn)/glutamyl-tRNA(Gln) amidotransferase subunit A
MADHWTLSDLAKNLSEGRITARALIETSLARIADPSLQGAHAFITIKADAARAQADASDHARKDGSILPRFAGIPISVKDLFDLEGDVTTAGSIVLKDSAPAPHDAPAIARLKQAGFIVMGRTNMTEFAYSGVGLNPHYGTPLSAYDRKTGRIPGGSSSGAAVSVADGMVAAGIGSDTGGSCRIPAAYNGIVGYKPSRGRVSTKGAYPLSSSFDSIGPLANSVSCCAALDAVMAGDWDGVIGERLPSSLKFGVLKTTVLDGLDPEVARDFERAISVLSKAGAAVEDFELPELLELPQLTVKGGIVAYEAYHHHRSLLTAHGTSYDRRVAMRLQSASGIAEGEYRSTLARRQAIIGIFTARLDGFTGLLMPSVMNVPPPVSALAEDSGYLRYNGMSLRNTYIGNFLDGCALSLPMNRAGEAPTGLMILDRWNSDAGLFDIAAWIEKQLKSVLSQNSNFC